MPNISIITPWSGNTGAMLLPEYAAAVGASEVITVDNASHPETAAALAKCGGVYIRNESNQGFAGGNNIGYARATGDIIVFLNSDVAPAGPWLEMVAADVRDGALYGPSLAQQLVAGRWLPYLEGWCIAATRATWERLVPEECKQALVSVSSALTEDDFSKIKAEIIEYYSSGRSVLPGLAGTEVTLLRPELAGPWDSLAYPGPYWEDNDLCLRAAQAGIALVQTAWPIQHKGGRTAGPIMRHAASFAANERTYTDRVLAALGERTPQPTPVYNRYLQECATQSDIQHHLPLLYSLARGTIVELGTRGGVSTAAFLAGVEARGGHVWSVDLDDCSHLYAGHPLWTFVQGSSIDPWVLDEVGVKYTDQANSYGTIDDIDILFIDTEHTYDLASAELNAWHDRVAPGGYILMHDPETFPGVRRAAQEFADARGWPITFVRPCNGMAVIVRPSE